MGGADKITPEMDAKIREIADEFALLDAEGRDLATVRLKAHAEKIVAQMRDGGRVRRLAERKAGDGKGKVNAGENHADGGPRKSREPRGRQPLSEGASADRLPKRCG